MADSPPSGFLDSLTPQEHRDFLRRSRRRRYRAGMTLFREGERLEDVSAVLSGHVKVSYFTDEGQEIVVAIRGPGELLGHLEAIDGEPAAATGTALGVVETMVVRAESFTEFLQEYPRVALVVMRILSRVVRDATRRRIQYGSLDTTGRVAARLADLADQYGEASGDGVRIALRLTQEELAALIGVSREAVSKALRTLRERGWIETHRRGVTVLNRDALRLHAT